jgi:hypothetical protein
MVTKYGHDNIFVPKLLIFKAKMFQGHLVFPSIPTLIKIEKQKLSKAKGMLA